VQARVEGSLELALVDEARRKRPLPLVHQHESQLPPAQAAFLRQCKRRAALSREHYTAASVLYTSTRASSCQLKLRFCGQNKGGGRHSGVLY